MLDFFWAIVSDIIEIPKPTRSEARWAVSVKIAMEFDIIPPVIWTAMKKTETKETINSLRIDFLFDSAAACFLAKKLMGVLTAIGVPWASGMYDMLSGFLKVVLDMSSL